MTNMTSDDEIKSMMPKTMYLLNSIERLLKAGALLSVAVIIVGFIIYASLKYGEKSHLYKTHQYQYQYDMSGTFLQTFDPAFVLFVFHTSVVFVVVYIFFRVFDYDWRVLRFSRDSSRDSVYDAERGKETTISKILLKRMYQATIVLLFLTISVLLNVGYIFLTTSLNAYGVAAIQLTLLLINACKLTFLPIFVSYLFWDEGSLSHNTISVKIMAGLSSFLDIAIPFIATLFSSDLCFQQYMFNREKITTEYSYPQCLLFLYDGSCYTPSIVEIVASMEFQPSPVYSGQCRNAIIQQYLPLVIYGSAFQAFGIPIAYFWFTHQLYDLYEIVTIFGVPTFEAREYILPDLTYIIILIWGEFLLLLTYGVVSPYAALSIGANICSMLYLLRMAISRYYHVQFHHVENKSDVKRDHTHLEIICENCQKHIHLILWPGVTISSVLFSLFLFDMAYDTDNPLDSLGVSLTIMFLTLAIIPCAMIIHNYFQQKVQQTLTTRMSEVKALEIEMQQNHHVDGIQNPMVVDHEFEAPTMDGR